MSNNTKLMLAAAAMTGLLAGSAARASVTQPGGKAELKKAMDAGTKVVKMAEKEKDKDGCGGKDGCKGKHECKGHNECKGQGGCKTGDNGCKAKNSCKGHGGCNTKEPATKPAADPK